MSRPIRPADIAVGNIVFIYFNQEQALANHLDLLPEQPSSKPSSWRLVYGVARLLLDAFLL